MAEDRAQGAVVRASTRRDGTRPGSPPAHTAFMNDNGKAQTNADTAQTNADNPDFLFGSLSRRLIGLFYRVYDRLGFGFLESVYKNAFAKELEKAGIAFEREAQIVVWYDGDPIGHFRADFLVEGKIIVEVKASQNLVEADRKQLLNYLRGSDVEVGLLLHFGPKAAHQRLVYSNTNKRSCLR
jgi:GxxExxY protein